jgi:hypothetical protein
MLNSLIHRVYCTTCFNFQKFYILTAEICYMFHNFSERNSIISLNSINQLVFVIETQCVLCMVGTGFLNKLHELKLERSSEDSQSRQTVKYGHESRGTKNQEPLCWRGPAAV